MEDKIKLFLQYMKKEKELLLEWDKEDGIDVEADDYKLNLTCVDRVKAFIAYRNVRVEEAWYTRLNSGNNSREIREKICDYDAERSRRHSRALNSIIGFNAFGQQHGLPPFYDGEVLDPKDIEVYKNGSVRKEETDFFLQFIDKLSRVPSIRMQKYFEEADIEPDAKEENSFIRELQSSVESVDRKYGVEETLLSDDGNIKFSDDKLTDRFNR